MSDFKLKKTKIINTLQTKTFDKYEIFNMVLSDVDKCKD